MAAGVLVLPTLTYTSAMHLNDGPRQKQLGRRIPTWFLMVEVRKGTVSETDYIKK